MHKIEHYKNASLALINWQRTGRSSAPASRPKEFFSTANLGSIISLLQPSKSMKHYFVFPPAKIDFHFLNSSTVTFLYSSLVFSSSYDWKDCIHVSYYAQRFTSMNYCMRLSMIIIENYQGRLSFVLSTTLRSMMEAGEWLFFHLKKFIVSACFNKPTIARNHDLLMLFR